MPQTNDQIVNGKATCEKCGQEYVIPANAEQGKGCICPACRTEPEPKE